MERREDAVKAEDPVVMLGLLAAVERDSALTQRHLARELGIALGLANAYLRRCATKGLIKIREAPLNRYAYYLTPRGFAEKGRLTAEYLAISFDFFRRARHECAALLAACDTRGWRRVALAGAGELAEIAALGATETNVEIVAVIDPSGGSCAGKRVVGDLASLLALGEGQLDAVIITDARTPQACFDAMLAAAAEHNIAADRILAPDLLRITTRPRRGARGASR
ncbi:MAG: winged helix-turn-helix transcriptional regulator [Rhizomicrobium sp.]